MSHAINQKQNKKFERKKKKNNKQIFDGQDFEIANGNIWPSSTSILVSYRVIL